MSLPERADYSLTESALSPFPAEPAQKDSLITDKQAKLTIYQAFVEGALEAPKHLARRVHELYFNPQFEDFAPRTQWSLSNAFTSAFKDLDPIPQFRATAKLATVPGE